MKVYTNWDEERCKAVARKSGVKQTEKDVSFGRFLYHHNPKKLYILRNDYSFLIANKGKKVLRIVGIAITEEYQRKGIGSILLNKAICDAKEMGMESVTTRSKEGASFYIKAGFDIVGCKGDDYLLELKIN